MKTCPQCKMRYPDNAATCFIDQSALVSLPDPRLGTTLAGRYVLDEVIGEGGMATVYRARHQLIERTCAVKILKVALAHDKVFRERFRREARNAQKLAHPNIVEILDHGETDDGTAYMVMEYLSGSSLGEVLEKGPLDLERAVGVMIQMARGIARAHDLDVIHRDLKPDNIFLGRTPQGIEVVKLLDFGIARSMPDARLTGAGEIFGTPQYMAPERITGTEAGPSSDLYALGVVFFEVVTGKLPFLARDVASFFVKHLKDAPLPARSIDPNVPEELDVLIGWLLAKEPASRPADAHRVHEELLTIAKKCSLAIPAEPGFAQTATLPSRQNLAEDTSGAWGNRLRVFRRMLDSAGGPTQEQMELLGRIEGLTWRAREIHQQGLETQRALEKIAGQQRHTRQQFGSAVDALGIDASKAREKLRILNEQATKAKLANVGMAAEFAGAHREILMWEGRTALSEPHAELAAAYRAAANLIDHWLEQGKGTTSADAESALAEQAVVDLEFQIYELMSALAHREKALESGRSEWEAKVVSLSDQAKRISFELFSLAANFCEPFRGRVDFLPLFHELERARASSDSC